MIAANTARRGSALDLTYAVTISAADAVTLLPRLVAELNQVEGSKT